MVLLGALDASLAVYQADPSGECRETDHLVFADRISMPNERVHMGRLELLAAGRFLNRDSVTLVAAAYDEIFLFQVDAAGRLRQMAKAKPGFIPLQIAAMDYDGDGVDELIAAHADPDGISIFSLQNQEFRLLKRESLDISMIGNVPQALIVADLNGDAIPDAVVAGFDGQVRYVMSGETEGVNPGTERLSLVVNDLTVGDYDGDGRAEVLLSGLDIEARSPVFSLLYGNRPGVFTDFCNVVAPRTYSLLQTLSVLTLDLNGDLLPDIVLADRDADRVIFYVNTTARKP
jgi:hypothetical protein